MSKQNEKKGKAIQAYPYKITVLGIGNVLLSDEGIGVHVVKELENLKLPPYVEVIEGGTDGFGLLNIITETNFLIVIDSLKGGGPPGTFYKFKIEEAPHSPDIFKTSIHQVGILEVLNLSSLIGTKPQTIVFGIEPNKITTGLELSSDIKKKIPRLIELIQAEIGKIVKNSHFH